MPLTKKQAKDQQRIKAWRDNVPYKANAKAKPEVPVLTEEEVRRDYIPEKVRELGAFYTPQSIAEDLWYYLSGYVPNPYWDHVHKTLEPCAGIGNLVAEGQMVLTLDVDAIEYDPESAALGKRLKPEYNWITGNAFEVDIEPDTYELVVCNPPYNIQCGPRVEGMRSNKSEYQFLELAIKALAPEGLGAFVCPQNFWDKMPFGMRELLDKTETGLVMSPIKLRGEFAQTSISVYLFLFKKKIEDYERLDSDNKPIITDTPPGFWD